MKIINDKNNFYMFIIIKKNNINFYQNFLYKILSLSHVLYFIKNGSDDKDIW